MIAVLIIYPTAAKVKLGVKTKSKISEIIREEEKCKINEKIKKAIEKIRIEEIN